MAEEKKNTIEISNKNNKQQSLNIMMSDDIIHNLVYVVRGQQVMLDSDLATLYQVETRVLNQAVKRNIARFPEKFCFQVSSDEYENLKSQFVISNLEKEYDNYGGRRTLPYVFNEQGIAILSAVLRSDTAIQVSIRIMETFVEMRRYMADDVYAKDISRKIISSFRTKQKNGEYIGLVAPYGYLKSKENKNKFVVDVETAPVVRRIFQLYADGKGLDMIVRIFQMVIEGIPRKDIVKTLNAEGVPAAAVYKQRKGCTRDWFPEGKKGGWNTSMVAKIIRDERYAGHMISRKKVYEDFEPRHQIDVDRSEWIVVRNTHEGIVTQEEFDQANGNMRSVVQGKKVNLADKRNYSVIVCPYCGLRLRPGNRDDSFMYCPTGRHHKESVCRQVKIKRNVAENTLVQIVRKQAEMLIQAEEMLKDWRNGQGRKPAIDMKVLKIELKKLEEGKIADYERYKAGEISKELFIERKQTSDVRKKELDFAMVELEAQSRTCDAGQNEYREAFEIKKYLHLESYDKSVMASLISSAKVIREDRLEIVWKYQDIYEKIFAKIQG